MKKKKVGQLCTNFLKNFSINKQEELIILWNYLQKMLQRITPIFALAMVILGITCPGTSEGFAIERHWKLHDSTQETNICRLSLGAENYEKFAGICDECSAVFNVNEMHGLCQ